MTNKTTTVNVNGKAIKVTVEEFLFLSRAGLIDVAEVAEVADKPKSTRRNSKKVAEVAEVAEVADKPKSTRRKVDNRKEESRKATTDKRNKVRDFRSEIRDSMTKNKAFKFLTDGAKVMPYAPRLAATLTKIHKDGAQKTKFYSVAQCDDDLLDEVAEHVLNGSHVLMFVSNAPYRIDALARMHGATMKDDRFAVRQWLNDGGKWVDGQPVDFFSFDTPEERITCARTHYVTDEGKVHGQIHLLTLGK